MRRDVREAFERHDSRRAGLLTRVDFRAAHVDLLGFEPLPSEVEPLFAAHAAPPAAPRETPQCSLAALNGGLPEDAFAEYVLRRMVLVDPVDEARQMFQAFDREGRGFLTFGDVEQTFVEVHGMTADRAAQVFAAADPDGDGRVCFREFLELVMWSG
jgi:Ca2+-binding EF-hand superfamily protein